MGHRIDTPEAVRYSGLFPSFEADAMTAMIENEALGDDDVADLVLLNYKGADFVGHAYGPDSSELLVTLGEMDKHLARIIAALEAKVGKDYLIAVTADHGMPPAPASPNRRPALESRSGGTRASQVSRIAAVPLCRVHARRSAGCRGSHDAGGVDARPANP